MADLRGFDANEVHPTTSYAPIPAGDYLTIITESEMKPTRSGNGHYLQLTFEVIEGPYKGRRLWARLNLDHPNPAAVQIAKAELAAICRAVGVLAPNDSTDLHDLPLVIHVKCKKRPDTGEIGNEVKGYSPKAALTEPAVKPAAPSTNGKATTPPWKR